MYIMVNIINVLMIFLFQATDLKILPECEFNNKIKWVSIITSDDITFLSCCTTILQ